jgi:hypothetical protein
MWCDEKWSGTNYTFISRGKLTLSYTLHYTTFYRRILQFREVLLEVALHSGYLINEINIPALPEAVTLMVS